MAALKTMLLATLFPLAFIFPQNKVDPKSVSSSVEYFGENYFPLTDNTSFNFESNMGKTKAFVYAENDQMVFAYESGYITYKQNLIKNASGIYLTKVYSKAFLFSTTVTYDKPLLRLPLPIKIGDTWQWEGNEIVDGKFSKLHVTGSALGTETIKTKAGEFRCLKILLKIVSANGNVNTEMEWLAPNVGIVKVRAKIQGDGVSGLIQKLMGLDEVKFLLVDIKK